MTEVLHLTAEKDPYSGLRDKAKHLDIWAKWVVPGHRPGSSLEYTDDQFTPTGEHYDCSMTVDSDGGVVVVAGSDTEGYAGTLTTGRKPTIRMSVYRGGVLSPLPEDDPLADGAYRWMQDKLDALHRLGPQGESPLDRFDSIPDRHAA